MKLIRQIPKNKIMIGGTIGNCVHVAGVFSYLQWAIKAGYNTVFLGAAISPQKWSEAIVEHDPGIVCISYRLTPSTLVAILDEFSNILEKRELMDQRLFYFGGTPGCIEIAKKYPYFTEFFQGEENYHYIMSTMFLDEKEIQHDIICERLPLKSKDFTPLDLRNMLRQGKYYPMLRHHFGLPSLENSIAGIAKIAESKVVDVISLAPDQNAQEFFFEPEKMDPKMDGSGGIPIRNEYDLRKLWEASRQGNFPSLKIYSGTNHLVKWAEISQQTIENAWGTIPLFWYSVLDGRSSRTVEEALKENMGAIYWYATRNIPIEINESHHWSLRESSDVIAVAAFYIAAYNAKKLGVRTYIAQLMFNTPRLTTAKMDLAKMLAKLELVSELEDDSFICLKQIRAGLSHFSIDMDIAKGQLAASTLLALAIKPQIIHVVSFSEADHAAEAEDVIESCKIVRGVLRNAWDNFPDLTLDIDVQTRKEDLIKRAKYLLSFIRDEFSGLSSDPLSDIKALTRIVKQGVLDAPHLLNNIEASGTIKTASINGGYEAIDHNYQVLSEIDR